MIYKKNFDDMKENYYVRVNNVDRPLFKEMDIVAETWKYLNKGNK